MSWLEAQQHWLGHKAENIRVNSMRSIDAYNNRLDVIPTTGIRYCQHLKLFGVGCRRQTKPNR